MFLTMQVLLLARMRLSTYVSNTLSPYAAIPHLFPVDTPHGVSLTALR